MIATALAAAAMAMPMPAGPAGAGAQVAIPGRFFAPAELHVLAGQTVTWSNGDSAVHNIAAVDGSFDSGRLAPGGTYAHGFDAPATVRYFCRIHRSMRGIVRVSALALAGPEQPLRPGAMATLTVTAAPGTPEVQLERDGQPVAAAAPDADGRASFDVVADAPAHYRARAGELTSETVTVHVAPVVKLTARRSGASVRVRATIAPAQAGARVELGDYVRERFDYAPLREGHAGAASTVTWTLRTGRRLRLRARLTKPVGGFSMSDSAAVIVPRRR